MNRITLGILIIAVCACSKVHAQLEINFYTMDGGGGTSSGGSFSVTGTIGQPDGGPEVLANGSFMLQPGFWHAATSAPCAADWNGSGFVNTADFLAYLNDYNIVLAGGTPVFGNPDLAAPIGVLNTVDFLAFLNLYNGGCP